MCHVYRITCLIGVFHLSMCYHHSCMRSEWFLVCLCMIVYLVILVMASLIESASSTHTQEKKRLIQCGIICCVCPHLPMGCEQSLSPLPINYSYNNREQSLGFMPLINFRTRENIFTPKRKTKPSHLTTRAILFINTYMRIRSAQRKIGMTNAS